MIYPLFPEKDMFPSWIFILAQWRNEPGHETLGESQQVWLVKSNHSNWGEKIPPGYPLESKHGAMDNALFSSENHRHKWTSEK